MRQEKVTILSVLLLLAATAWAQLSLEIDLNFLSGLAKIADLEAGFFDYPSGSTLSIDSTEPWQLHLRTGNAQIQGETSSKPVGDLLWRTPQGSYSQLTGTDQLVAQGEAGQVQVEVDYRMLLSWLDPPGTYTVTLLYTLTSQGAP